MGENPEAKRRKEVERKMLTEAGRIILGIIATSTSLFLMVYFLEKCLNEKQPKVSFGYLVMFIGCMFSLLFSINMM
ncbi:hypothetical protein [Clostridium sp. B9]|uniref:hypothetical protein n=1 Tax=Clostridium sp. B9 TaxID=3423224 RepID=UPI003D2EB56E